MLPSILSLVMGALRLAFQVQGSGPSYSLSTHKVTCLGAGYFLKCRSCLVLRYDLNECVLHHQKPTLSPSKVRNNSKFCIAAYVFGIRLEKDKVTKDIKVYLMPLPPIFLCCFSFSVAILFSFLKLESPSINLRS